MIFFWIAESTADIAADNRHGNKTLLARGASTIFINAKPAFINGLTKFENPPTSLSFVSLFIRVIADSVTDKIPFLIFVPSKLNLPECHYLFF